MSLPESFALTAEDAKLLLAANVHLGSKNVQVCFPQAVNAHPNAPWTEDVISKLN